MPWMRALRRRSTSPGAPPPVEGGTAAGSARGRASQTATRAVTTASETSSTSPATARPAGATTADRSPGGTRSARAARAEPAGRVTGSRDCAGGADCAGCVGLSSAAVAGAVGGRCGTHPPATGPAETGCRPRQARSAGACTARSRAGRSRQVVGIAPGAPVPRRPLTHQTTLGSSAACPALHAGGCGRRRPDVPLWTVTATRRSGPARRGVPRHLAGPLRSCGDSRCVGQRSEGATTTASMPGPTCAPTTAPTSLCVQVLPERAAGCAGAAPATRRGPGSRGGARPRRPDRVAGPVGGQLLEPGDRPGRRAHLLQRLDVPVDQVQQRLDRQRRPEQRRRRPDPAAAAQVLQRVDVEHRARRARRAPARPAATSSIEPPSAAACGGGQHREAQPHAQRTASRRPRPARSLVRAPAAPTRTSRTSPTRGGPRRPPRTRARRPLVGVEERRRRRSRRRDRRPGAQRLGHRAGTTSRRPRRTPCPPITTCSGTTSMPRSATSPAAGSRRVGDDGAGPVLREPGSCRGRR